MSRTIVDVAVILPDASPGLTLARVGRVDLLGRGDRHDAEDTHDPVRESRSHEKVSIDLIETELRTMNDELAGCTLYDVLEKLEKGKIGHRAAMEWRDISSQNDRVEIMHVNGRLMPGHQPMRISDETPALIRAISRPLPPKASV